MMTFHGGGSKAIDMTMLRALFGYGEAPLYGSLLPDPSPTASLAVFLNATAHAHGYTPASCPAPVAGAALAPIVDAVVEALSGAVAHVHVQVLFKQLVEVWRVGVGPGGLVRTAKEFGRDPLIVATIHGTVPRGPFPESVIEHRRLDLVLGRRP